MTPEQIERDKFLYFSFRGRVGLADYFIYLFVPWVIMANILFQLAELLAGSDYFFDGVSAREVALYAWFTLTAIPFAAMNAKRLHDHGRSGWWQVLYSVFYFVPWLGLILFLVGTCTKGTAGENAFGAPRKESVSSQRSQSDSSAVVSGDRRFQITDISYLWFAAFAVSVCVVLVFSFVHSRQESAAVATQSTTVGRRVTAPDATGNLLLLDRMGRGAASVPFVLPQDLSGKTRQDILAMRESVMKTYQYALQSGTYTPDAAIYGGIEDGKPWWGWYGIMLYGPGKKSIVGPSFRADSILNPLALVWANLWEQSLTLSHSWNNADLPESPENDTRFPVQPFPSSIEVDADTKVITVHMPLDMQIKALHPYFMPRRLTLVPFTLEAVNARDLGYPYIAVNAEQTSNIHNQTHPLGSLGVVKTAGFYHVGGSCGYAGGCNNLSPFEDILNGYVISKLPAVLELKLWHAEPQSADEQADIVYRIYFD